MDSEPLAAAEGQYLVRPLYSMADRVWHGRSSRAAHKCQQQALCFELTN